MVPWFLSCASCSWPLLTDSWFCCHSSAGRLAAWIGTSLRPRCWRGIPHTQQQETPGTRGFPNNQTKPTHSHSLPQTCSSIPLLLLPPLPLLTGLLTGSPWNSGPCLLIEHTHQKDKMTTLPSSPHPHLCSLCFNYWGWPLSVDQLLLAQSDIP